MTRGKGTGEKGFKRVVYFMDSPYGDYHGDLHRVQVPDLNLLPSLFPGLSGKK